MIECKKREKMKKRNKNILCTVRWDGAGGEEMRGIPVQTDQNDNNVI